jgi:hypothetical protein
MIDLHYVKTWNWFSFQFSRVMMPIDSRYENRVENWVGIWKLPNIVSLPINQFNTF